MTLTFVTNLVHHHQLPVADEFYRLLGDSYHYVATQPLPEWLIKGGYDPNLVRPYIVRTYLSDNEMKRARRLIDESDVVIMGDAPSWWADRRKQEEKITFYCTERIYKKGIPWLKLPWHAYLHYKSYGRYNNTYLLCASAYTSSDYSLTGCFLNKSFKWGYFTKVEENFSVEAPQGVSTPEIAHLMWCARFLVLKHPELPVQLAARLKSKGYQFHLDMYGSGDELSNIKTLINDLNVEDCVTLCGNKPNDDILKEMQHHEIFLFTSDRNEGWGAVLNESMANGCVPVASDAIGSVPYLVKDGLNGRVFHSCDIISLENAVCSLLDNPDMRRNMSREALKTMRDVWSPQKAAENFVDLANHILEGKLNQYARTEGPASWEQNKYGRIRAKKI